MEGAEAGLVFMKTVFGDNIGDMVEHKGDGTHDPKDVQKAGKSLRDQLKANISAGNKRKFNLVPKLPKNKT